MSQLIYIETSIPSFYHETRAAGPFQTMREWTREWWDIARQRDELVTSLAVIAELEDAPEPKRTKALRLLEPLPLLRSSETIDEMVAVYVKHKVMPADATGDARHLALATFYRCDVLASWNCKHIANVNKRGHIESINAMLGYETPLLTTPFELLEIEP